MDGSGERISRRRRIIRKENGTFSILLGKTNCKKIPCM
jgi:hypothetical protein